MTLTMNETQGVTKLIDIETPSHLDVLCGRGVGTNRHSGNEYFRNLVMTKEGLYSKSTKNEKMVITRSIVQIVRECGGRFLDKNPFTGLWYDVGDKKAIEKTSQALRDGPATRKKDTFVQDSPRSMSGIEPTYSCSEYYDSRVYQQSPAIVSSDIQMSPKQTFQQHFDSMEEAVHSPKMRKLQPRPIHIHRRAHTAGEMVDVDLKHPTDFRNQPKLVLNIFRSRDESVDIPSIKPSYHYDVNAEYPSPRTYWVEYSRSQHGPIYRTYSEPMDRESISSLLDFPSLENVVPEQLILSFDKETADTIVITNKESECTQSALINDVSLDGRSSDSYDNSFFKYTNQKPKLTPFDWTNSPVITKMKVRENMETVPEDLPYFPRAPSWSNLITPEKAEDPDPYPFDDRLDAFQINLETVQSFLEPDPDTNDGIVINKLDESSVGSDILPFSLPDIIDPKRRTRGGNVSPLTTPTCDGDTFDNSSLSTL